MNINETPIRNDNRRLEFNSPFDIGDDICTNFNKFKATKGINIFN